MKIYNTQQAAEYLGFSISSIKYHVYIAKDIKAKMFGNSLMFTKNSLDRFSKNRRSPGRPRKDT
jgi:hypothetical protein